MPLRIGHLDDSATAERACRRPIILFALVLGVLMSGPASGAESSAPQSCIVLAEAASPTTEDAPTPTKAEPPTAVDRELRGPISEQEARLLIEALEPMPLADRRGRTIRAVRDGTDLEPERMNLLVGDVTVMLAAMHAAEALAELDDLPGMRADRRAWGQEALQAIENCAKARFRERGARAFEVSKKIVEQHRRALERVLLEADR